MNKVPVISLDNLHNPDPTHVEAEVQQLREACLDTGFLYVANHGISPALINNMHIATKHVFAQPDAVKAAFRVSRDSYAGYIPLGFFSPAGASETADQYEGFKLHIDADEALHDACGLYAPRAWPPSLGDVADTVAAYWAELDRVSEALLHLFARALGIAPEVFLPHFRDPLTNMTMLHYPPQDRADAGFGIHPHKDSSAFTIIAPEPVGGLQIKTQNGEWMDATPPDNALIVNIGDVMEHWTGGQFKSTPHRVINRSGQERYSFPYFATPRHDTIIAPVVPPVEGYDRPPIAMGEWYSQIIASNWPDAEPLPSDLDPRTLQDSR